MLKRILALLFCFLIPFTAFAEGWMNTTDQPDAVVDVTTDTAYNSADSIGQVVNGQPKDPTQQQQVVYSFTPMDVVLVLDASGSMSRSHSLNNKSLLSYAQDAAIAFGKTLYSINPASRIAVVTYDTTARTVADFTGIGDQNTLFSQIRNIGLGNLTNTGGGMELAVSMLNQSAMPGRQQTVLLLSDGLANEGAADPIQYAIDQGYIAGNQGLVYTIGLVGGMGESDKQITRKTLAAGYETRYFEVDFDDVGDITSTLSAAFMTIAMAGSTLDDNAVCYRLWVDGDMELYIQNSAGEYLSSVAWDYKDSASFGSFYILGDHMDEKMVVLYGDDYRITLHGTRTGQGSYTLTELRGVCAAETNLLTQTLQTHPAMYHTIRMQDGACTTVDESYNPLDIHAIDPFTGEQTRGLEIPALGTTSAQATVRSFPGKSGEKIGKIAKNTSISVLAVDTDDGYYFISFPDEDDFACRGWVPVDNVKVTGYVPEMCWFDFPAAATADATAYRLPSDLFPAAGSVPAGQALLVRHAERDLHGNEWLYVQPDGQNKIVYIPASAVGTWTPQTSEEFRIGYASAQYVWRVIFGSNFTEVAWAAPQKDGSGVVLSGRTTSKKKPFKTNYGERDAFAIMMDPAGALELTVTAGGTGMDSYHCILPAAEGYYVSGVTRSNNKDFTDIWDPASTTGNVSAKPKRTNALIGHLNEDFSIDWMKSFGTGAAGYGFDMVIQLADGNIAGAGWMTSDSKEAIPGNGKQDFYVVKMTPDGQVIATANFGSSVNDVPDSAVATPDGGLIIAGMHRRNTHADGWIVVLDSSLNLVSECSYGGSGEDVFDNIRPMADGTYLVTGFTDSPTGNGIGDPKGGVDFWAMNIDAHGRSNWVKRYGGSADEELCGTAVLDNGTFLLLGLTHSTNGDVLGATGKDEDAWAICIDQNGRLLWQYASGLKGNDCFNTATIDPADGCYVLAGRCNRKNSNTAQALVIKLQPYAD